MGDLLSAIISNLFMEDLKTKAITTAALLCRPSLWKRYVDVILEEVKRTHESPQYTIQWTPPETSSSPVKMKESRKN